MTAQIEDRINELVDEMRDKLEEVMTLLGEMKVGGVEETPETTHRLRRIGDSYSMLKWRRENTGSYVARASNGVELKVFRLGKGEWFGQVGQDVINEKPLSYKIDAVEAVENVLIG